MAGNDFDDNGAKPIAQALQQHNNLHTLNLSDNKFKENGIMLILTELSSRPPSIDTLILGNAVKI